MARKAKTGKKQAATTKLSTTRLTLGFGLTRAERDAVIAKAEKLAGGNVSAFLRHAALTCKTRAK